MCGEQACRVAERVVDNEKVKQFRIYRIFQTLAALFSYSGSE